MVPCQFPAAHVGQKESVHGEEERERSSLAGEEGWEECVAWKGNLMLRVLASSKIWERWERRETNRESVFPDECQGCQNPCTLGYVFTCLELFKTPLMTSRHFTHPESPKAPIPTYFHTSEMDGPLHKPSS